MPRGKNSPKNGTHKKPIEQYDHKDKKRTNNPPVGLVTPENDQDKPAGKYAYDPHLDPQLVWAGKAERTSFEVPTVSLHVHERIDPRTIIEAVRKRNGDGQPAQGLLFDSAPENPPLRDAIDFYKHPHDWSNRLIAGDSLLVTNSLLEKEGMAGQVQMVYIDPPYGIKYGSNFQPFVNTRDVKDGKDEDLTQQPEMIQAFRDTWELGIHSYLTYLRDRIVLAKQLLNQSGSCFVQISDVNLHLVRNLMDEVFGATNICSVIPFTKTTSTSTTTLPVVCDYLIWYAQDVKALKYHKLYRDIDPAEAVCGEFKFLEFPDGTTRNVSDEERHDPSLIPKEARLFRTNTAVSPEYSPNLTVEIDFGGGIKKFPGENRHWKTSVQGMLRLRDLGRLDLNNSPTRMFKRYLRDFPVIELNNVWTDTRSEQDQVYVVQTVVKVIERCVLMTTDPGDLVFDPTCGSGTTAFVAEQWGRRWITCDTSRVAVTLARQRLMTTVYDYYDLAHPEEGVGSGFRYKTTSHIMLGSIANNEPTATETLYDQPYVDKSRARVSGPFTVEAVPAPTVKSLSEVEAEPQPADVSIARSGATLRHSEWRDELLKTGIRGKGGQMIEFSRVEPLSGTRWIHADAETKEAKPERVVVAFGPQDAPLDQRQVEMAWEDARTLRPKPSMIVFASFQFDPEAAKDIDELRPEKTGMTFLKVQMNTDLLTEDLKKKRASNQSFWLVGQPDIELREITKDEQKGKWQVEVHGFDYYNTKTGVVESGDTSKIAVWLLDTDYDGRSLYPRQVFFPIADEDGGWTRLTKNLKAEINPELIEAYRGTVSLPFEAGKHKRVAVKIVDDRGIESLKIVELR
ncbi:MAG TPA: DNA methyltransferase [Terriglobia bacterium]|nr:DNA methyltransferase [Terriglobia bacterium]